MKNEGWKWFAWDEFSRSWPGYKTIPGETASSHPKSTLFSRKTIPFKQQLCNCQEWNPGFAEEKRDFYHGFQCSQIFFPGHLNPCLTAGCPGLKAPQKAFWQSDAVGILEFPGLPVALPQPELVWGSSSCRLPVQRHFLGRKEIFQVYLHCQSAVTDAGAPAQLSVLMNTPSVRFLRKYHVLVFNWQ